MKERTFRADLRVVDRSTNTPAVHLTSVLLEMRLYTAECPPRLIEYNTSGRRSTHTGNAIFKGCTTREVKDGTCVFDKLQIKEVSSHFRNGWVFVAVVAKVFGPDGVPGDHPDGIEPLVVDNVYIRAKLSCKRRDTLSDTDPPN